MSLVPINKFQIKYADNGLSCGLAVEVTVAAGAQVVLKYENRLKIPSNHNRHMVYTAKLTSGSEGQVPMQLTKDVLKADLVKFKQEDASKKLPQEIVIQGSNNNFVAAINLDKLGLGSTSGH